MSIEQSIALVIGLYFLLDLKLHPHRTTMRFLYFYLLADKNQQSNVIHRFCKEYDSHIADNPPLRVENHQLATNNTLVHHNSTTKRDGALSAVQHGNKSRQLSGQTNKMQPEPESVSNQQSSPSKRKVDDVYGSEQQSSDNNPPAKRPIRATRRKR